MRRTEVSVLCPLSPPPSRKGDTKTPRVSRLLQDVVHRCPQRRFDLIALCVQIKSLKAHRAPLHRELGTMARVWSMFIFVVNHRRPGLEQTHPACGIVTHTLPMPPPHPSESGASCPCPRLPPAVSQCVYTTLMCSVAERFGFECHKLYPPPLSSPISTPAEVIL